MNPTPDTAAGNPGLWFTISDLARRKGVSKQTISERVAKLEADKRLTTRTGEGRSKLVNLAEYDRAVGETTDLAREQGARTKRGEVDTAAGDPVYAREQARAKAYEADLKFIELQAALGKYVETDHVARASATCAAELIRGLDEIAHSGEALATAVAKAGLIGLRVALKKLKHDLRESVSAAFAQLAAALPSEDSTLDDQRES